MEVFEYKCVLANGDKVLVIAAIRRKDDSKMALGDRTVSWVRCSSYTQYQQTSQPHLDLQCISPLGIIVKEYMEPSLANIRHACTIHNASCLNLQFVAIPLARLKEFPGLWLFGLSFSVTLRVCGFKTGNTAQASHASRIRRTPKPVFTNPGCRTSE